MREYIVTSDLARMSVAQYQPIRELDLWQLTKPKVRLYLCLHPIVFLPLSMFWQLQARVGIFQFARK